MSPNYRTSLTNPDSDGVQQAIALSEGNATGVQTILTRLQSCSRFRFCWSFDLVRCLTRRCFCFPLALGWSLCESQMFVADWMHS
jgi:hypothetical protein